MWIKHLFNLFYPSICRMCAKPLLRGESVLCTSCVASLPYTGYWRYADNPVAKKFWGQIDVAAACSLLFFQKGYRVRKLVHLLKYKGEVRVGYKLGFLLGVQLRESALFSDVDYVIPVPLHPKKERKRGFNQSMIIAEGVAEALGAKVGRNFVRRTVNTQTQTKKNRIERYANVRSIFSVSNVHRLEGKHLLVVDDVITTGATIESCAAELLNAATCRVSIASVGTV